MCIYKQLQAARVDLLAAPIKKSGKNKFAGYEYFELEDFLPTVQKIFAAHSLCGVMSFSADTAKLAIHSGSELIEFTAPMATAELKGCHSIQNMGAVISYMRRYLYMLALEICEHDELDATTGKDKQKTAPDSDKQKYHAMLTRCASIAELQATWQTIPKNLHHSLGHVKDAMKTQLQEAA